MKSEEEVGQWTPEEIFNPHHIRLGELRSDKRKLSEPIKIYMPRVREYIEEDKDS